MAMRGHCAFVTMQPQKNNNRYPHRDPNLTFFLKLTKFYANPNFCSEYTSGLLNMAFISLSEVKNIIYFMSGEATNEKYTFFTSRVK